MYKKKFVPTPTILSFFFWLAKFFVMWPINRPSISCAIFGAPFSVRHLDGCIMSSKMLNFFCQNRKSFHVEISKLWMYKNVNFYLFQAIFTKTNSALKCWKSFLWAQVDHFFEKNISSRMLILGFLKTFLLISVHQNIYMPQNWKLKILRKFDFQPYH